MKFESAPKPRLTDESYRENYLSEDITIDERLKMVAEKNL